MNDEILKNILILEEKLQTENTIKKQKKELTIDQEQIWKQIILQTLKNQNP